ncbi:hypothetical protein F442_01649 [Phytophthora nicotianae P10297]|uniref:Uncharacterized protein n=1 Tax=Phytophthora nicotianae P10297 TaxID=1317064 RepID=W3A1D9_PHYNI|nr:hypothetical protein F442_01649 [Phytophthora nicotianae P10297]
MAREALAVPNWHTGAKLAVHRQKSERFVPRDPCGSQIEAHEICLDL